METGIIKTQNFTVEQDGGRLDKTLAVLMPGQTRS